MPLIADDPFFNFFQKQEFTYREALMVELARQIEDDAGLPAKAATRFVENAISGYFEAGTTADFWIAMVRCRNTWGEAPRGSWPVTKFGPKEYWDTAHFSGTYLAVTGSIAQYFQSLQAEQPDADPARIVLANVSTADRRLRKRAADHGIAVVSGEFA